MRIITISREFGSGGREIGKRLAGQLGVDYYDKEIITAIAGKKGLDEDYVSDILELSLIHIFLLSSLLCLSILKYGPYAAVLF